MLNQPVTQSAISHQENRQIDRARLEAEGLFRPKTSVAGTSAPSSGSAAGALVRKPRILRAILPSPPSQTAETASRLRPQAAPSALRPTCTDHDRLELARGVIYKRQRELELKLAAIDAELRAIAAYEEAKQDTGSRQTTRRVLQARAGH